MKAKVEYRTLTSPEKTLQGVGKPALRGSTSVTLVARKYLLQRGYAGGGVFHFLTLSQVS